MRNDWVRSDGKKKIIALDLIVMRDYCLRSDGEKYGHCYPCLQACKKTPEQEILSYRYQKSLQNSNLRAIQF